VGVRELKNSAPKLVRRAAAGERIVILRYGKPEAVLGPCEPDVSEEPVLTPQMQAWNRQRQAFERLSSRLQARYHGKYVAVFRGRVADADADHERLFARMWKRHRGAAFFIGRVGAPVQIVDMPGFDIE
jgi:antitoxin (DNA-binding transcriptional repressor) of toxin-antitoxin stability system